MNLRSAKSFCRWIPGLALLLAAGQAMAQRRTSDEPRWIDLYSLQGTLGVYAEVTDETSSTRSGNTLNYQRWFVGPSFGIDARGAFYHPNLAQWSVSGEFSPGWREETSSAGGALSRRSEFAWLNNFDARIALLSEKPYRSSLFLSQTHIFRDYNFFNSVTVDSLRYGGDTGYQEGPVPFRISVFHRTEESSGLATTSSLEDTGVVFDAANTRDSGETKLVATLTDYNRNDPGLNGQGTDATVNLTDSETFGSRQQMRLFSSVGFTHREYSDRPTDELSSSASLNYEHTPALNSSYDASYFHSESGPFVSDHITAGAGLQHQLYESLNSSLRGQTFNSTSSSEGSKSDFTQYLVTLGESYTKKLGERTLLNLSGSLSVEQNEQQNSGAANLARSEQHVFPGAGSGGPERFSLNLPYVVSSTIVVRDSTGIVPPGGNYTVFQNGALTYIERIGGSLRILPGATVFVDYDARPSASGSYQAYGRFGQIRFDFMDGRWGIFGRVASIENNAPPEIIAQEVWAWAVGADFNWRWLRAGAEYEFHDSSFSSYRSARLYQSLNFNLDDASTLTFDFTQTHTTFVDAHREEQYYSAIQRYHRSLTRYLGLDLESGASWRVGDGVDETRYRIRPGIQFAKGKLSLRAGYNFEYSKFLESEEHIRHMLFVRATRTF